MLFTISGHKRSSLRDLRISLLAGMENGDYKFSDRMQLFDALYLAPLTYCDETKIHDCYFSDVVHVTGKFRFDRKAKTLDRIISVQEKRFHISFSFFLVWKCNSERYRGTLESGFFSRKFHDCLREIGFLVRFK